MTKMEQPHVSVCICTHKRPDLLKRSLEGVSRQETGGQFTFSIVVADNDQEQSARQTVTNFESSSRVPIRYCVESDQNIAKARNKALAQATGYFVAFIDDDEFPAADWLRRMLTFCVESNADGVLGPVKPFFDEAPPKWILRGKFCDRSEYPSGFNLDWRQTRTGNVLFRRNMIEGIALPFRTEFGTGGEDQDFFRRMMQKGCRFVWCNEGVVYEVVPPQRFRRSYMLRRALQRGQNERYLLSLGSIAKSLAAVPCYALLALPLFLVRHDAFMKCLIRLCDHTGKLLAAIGLKAAGEGYLGQ